jgi:NAD+ diphosphatase
MPPQPELPRPAHLDQDSMLSRKFGKEVTNYFGSKGIFQSAAGSLTDYILSGSPLNRVSFLRGDHSFLKQAFEHDTTRFMVFRNLAPLVESPSEIAYAKPNDLQPIIPKNPFDKTEEDLIREYNSSISVPQLVFLGLDESKRNGLHYKNYIGAPQFAIDVTPKNSYEGEAKGVIAELEGRGLSFVEGMRAMNFPAEIGMLSKLFRSSHLTYSSCNICQGSSSPRLECTESLLRNLWSADSICQCRGEARLSTNRLGIFTRRSR